MDVATEKGFAEIISYLNSQHKKKEEEEVGCASLYQSSTLHNSFNLEHSSIENSLKL